MPDYSFVTIWRLDAPIERVYDAIRESLAWPDWWPAVTAVEEVTPGDEAGLGNVRRYTFRGQLPYGLTFDLRVTEIQRPTRLAGVASGELAGTGIWTLTPQDKGTLVRYDWNVRTTRWWMNLLAPIARPFFRWNHDYVMRSGARGICGLLGGVAGTCEWVQQKSRA